MFFYGRIDLCVSVSFVTVAKPPRPTEREMNSTCGEREWEDDDDEIMRVVGNHVGDGPGYVFETFKCIVWPSIRVIRADFHGVKEGSWMSPHRQHSNEGSQNL